MAGEPDRDVGGTRGAAREAPPSRLKTKKSLVNWFWGDLGLHLGRDWDGLGRLSNALRHLLAVSGIQNRGFVQAMVQAALQEATGIDFGRVWEGFGEGFGRFWERVGKHLGRLLVVWGGLEWN